LETDSCIYVRGNILLAVYVDDIQVVGPTKEECNAVYKELERHIKFEYKGPVGSLLGIEVIRNWDDHLVAINQSAHIDRRVFLELDLRMPNQQAHLSTRLYLS
jgi:hypothetical protein